jgi:Transposase domain (DUF772)
MPGIHAKKHGRGGMAAAFDVLGTPLRCSCIALPPAPMQSKALLLQSRHGLGDPGLEKQLARGLMSRRFVNLGLGEGVPGHSATWRSRNTPAKQGLLDTFVARGQPAVAGQRAVHQDGRGQHRWRHRHRGQTGPPAQACQRREHPRQRSRAQRQGRRQRQDGRHLRL